MRYRAQKPPAHKTNVCLNLKYKEMTSKLSSVYARAWNAPARQAKMRNPHPKYGLKNRARAFPKLRAVSFKAFSRVKVACTERVNRKKIKKAYLFIVVFFLCFSNFKILACPGRFVNPLTDICWSCLFPLSIGPVKVNAGGRDDTPNPSSLLCLCRRPPLPVPVPGIPVGFWEPVRLVDVTRIPFCMVSLGGLSLGNSFYKHGVHGKTVDQKGGASRSFYHVHWYVYPVIYWLELLMDFLCLEAASFDVAYLTELDPLWNDDETAFILNPEAVVFGNPVAQAACAADCAAASLGLPLDPLFWCGGCQGSLYPFTGTVDGHMGGVQASLLLVQRMAAKLHRQLMLWGTFGEAGLCGKYPMPLIRKSQYKIQMTYPLPTTTGPLACNPMGRTEVVWGSGREFPHQGEDFGYLIWRKRSCCVL